MKKKFIKPEILISEAITSNIMESSDLGFGGETDHFDSKESHIWDAFDAKEDEE